MACRLFPVALARDDLRLWVPAFAGPTGERPKNKPSQSQVGPRHRAIACEHPGLALADDAPQRQKIGSVRHLERAAGILLDHQDAHVVGNARERREQLAGKPRRKSKRRLANRDHSRVLSADDRIQPTIDEQGYTGSPLGEPSMQRLPKSVAKGR